ncbi:hypothetical protein U1Q18_051640 [Sarracenia purpurea var. burkii]
MARRKFFASPRPGVGPTPQLDQYKSAGQVGELGVAWVSDGSRGKIPRQPSGCRGGIQKPSDRQETGKYGSAKNFCAPGGGGGSDPRLDQYKSGGQGGELGVVRYSMGGGSMKTCQRRGCRGEIQKPSDRQETGFSASAKNFWCRGVGPTPRLDQYKSAGQAHELCVVSLLDVSRPVKTLPAAWLSG